MDTVPRWLLGVCSLLAVFCPIVTSDSWIPSSSSWVVDSAGTPSGVVSDAGKALDGNSGTFWNPEELAQNYNNWYITLDLGASYSLSKIKFQNYGDTTHDVSAFALQKSSSSTPYVWGNVVSNSGVATGHNSFQEYAFTATSARYWKFIVTRTPNGYQPYLKELQFYGSGVAVAGGWSAWDAWTECSVTCGNVTGSRTRTRRCDNPEPLFGGRSCTGDAQETSACSSDVPCPVIETGGSVGADHLLYPTLCMYGDGSTYRGSVNTTQSGLTCQRWDSQSPHAHNTTVTYPLAGLHENYCRNPDGAARPWCYTTDPDVAREYCDISNCFLDECYEGDGASYRGTVNVTKSGRACQYWANQTTHTHANTPENHPNSGLEENYCRNPNGTGYPWCYTQDPDVRDEECVIPRCDNEWTRYGTNYFRAYGEERKTYADAKATCAEENALLPIVKDSGTWDFLINLRDSSGITTTVWIGVTDLEEEGTFVWDDGSPPGWEPDPSSHKSHWDCAKMTRNEDDPPNQLLSANCTNTKYYICERITRPCSPNPCINNGTCVETVPSGFLCRCGQNYTGTYCGDSVSRKIIFPGPRGIDDYARMETTLSEDLTSFTLCMHMRSNMDSRNVISLVSYAVAESNNELFFGNREFKLCILVQSHGNKMADPPVWDGKWHAICTTWRSSDGAWQLYADGVLTASGSGFRVGGRVRKGGTWILGQDQDVVGGGFDADQAFTGELSGVNLWDRVLSPAEIAADCSYHGNVIDWDTTNIRVFGQASRAEYQCNAVATTTSPSTVATTTTPSTTATTTVPGTECPAGWSLFSGKCYKVFTDTVAYSQARQVCIDNGGSLAMVKNSEISSFMKTLSSDHKWFGLSDEVTEGQFLWEDGTSLTSTGFTDWYPGEPNGGSLENCVQYWRRTWNDRSCTDQLGFTCEVRATTPTPTPTPTPITVHESSVNIARGRPAWQSSTRYQEGTPDKAVNGDRSGYYRRDNSCSHTAADNNAWWYVDLESSHSVERVVIFNREDCCSGRLNPFRVHVGNSTAVASNPSCGGDHSAPNLTVACGGLTGRYVGVLLPGSSRVLTLCEVEVYGSKVLKWRDDSRCGDGYTVEDGSTAECNPDSDRPCCSPYNYCGYTTDHCDCEGCVDYRKPVKCDSWTKWLNVDNPGTTGDWESLHSIRRNLPGQVCDTPTKIDARVVGTGQDAWSTGENFAYYDATAGFVCRKVDQPDHTCLDYEVRFCCRDRNMEDWTKHGSSSYKFLQSTFVNYTEARALCDAEGAKLAMPKDQATHDFIVELRNHFHTNINLWIGLNDIDVEGDFVWEDGTPLGNLTRWFPNQPNNVNRLQHCAVLTPETNPYPNQWRDDKCSNTWGVICEKAEGGLCSGVACANHAVCVQRSEGELQCTCRNGYSGDGTVECQDIDECGDASHKCSRDELCFNTEGSYRCAQCYPDFTVQGGADIPASAVIILRRVGFFLRTETNIDCNVEYTVSFAWTVWSVEGSDSEQLNTTGKLKTSAHEIAIPKNFLPLGLNMLKVVVAVLEKDSGLRLNRSLERWVRIISSPIEARIAGGSARSVSFGSDIALDAAVSYDPDSIIKDSRLFNFSWTCRIGQVTPCDEVFLNVSTEAAYVIPSGVFRPNDTVTFTVDVSFSGRVSGVYVQAIHLGVEDPTISLRCNSNCNNRMNPSERLALQAVCENCLQGEQLNYNWTLQKAPSDYRRSIFNWETDTTTGNLLPDLVVQAEVFTKPGAYVLRVDVVRAEGVSGFAEYRFEPNTPPTVGTCSASPETGVAMVDEFSVQCTGFADSDLPMTFAFFYSTGGQRLVAINSTAEDDELSLFYSGLVPSTPPIPFPVGLPSRDYNVTIVVRATDVLGAQATVSLVVKVFPLPVEETSSVATQLTIGANSTLGKLVQGGNFQAAVQISNSVNSVLNVEATNATDQDKQNATKVRSSIISSLSEFKVQSVSSVNILANALSQATVVQEEVSTDSQVTAAASLVDLVEIIQNQPEEELGIEEAEESSVFLTSALVNVMRASSYSSQEAKSRLTGRTKADRLQQTQVATSTVFGALNTMNDVVLSRKRPNEKPTLLQQDNFELSLRKQTCDQMSSQIVTTTEANGGWFRTPDASILFGEYTCSEPVDSETYQTTLNPYEYSSDSDRIQSSVGALKYKNDRGELTVSNLESPVEVVVERRDAVQVQTERGRTGRAGTGVMSIHSFNVTDEENSIHVIVTPDLNWVPIRLYLWRQDQPIKGQYGWNVTLPLSSDQLYSVRWLDGEDITADPYSWFWTPEELATGEGQRYYLGVEHVPFNQSGFDLSDLRELENGTSEVEFSYSDENFTLPYTVTILSTRCLFFDDKSHRWKSDGCRSGPLTNANITHCFCDHLTAFGSDFQFFVAPNSLNILKALQGFNNISENPAVVITISVIVGIYLLMVLWARWKDRKDVEKVGATVLGSSPGGSCSVYQVVVFTGARSNSGTTAKVSVMFYGDTGESGPHELDDPRRMTFCTGGVDSFLVTSSGGMGPLNYIHIWHDNSGDDPSWFLSKIIVTDVNTDRKYYFLCDKWFAVEEGDGKVERIFPVASDRELKRFKTIFSSKTGAGFRDDHLWFSVLGRPAYSTFSRVQRVSCCLSLLLCTMLANIMFFGTGDSFQKPPAVNIFGFDVQLPISWGEIMIAIESALLVFPINLAIVQIFRHCGPRPAQLKETDQDHGKKAGRESSENSEGKRSCINSSPATVITEFTDDDRELIREILSSCRTPSQLTTIKTSIAKSRASKSSKTTRRLPSGDGKVLCDGECDVVREEWFEGAKKGQKTRKVKLAWQDKISLPWKRGSYDVKRAESVKKKKTKKAFLLPWWCVYIGWFFVFSSCFVSAFFTILYGFEYGRQKAEAWLFTFLTSFFFDLVIMQPIKILLLGIVFALIIKKIDTSGEEVAPTPIQEDEEYLVQEAKELGSATSMKPRATGPPDDQELLKARQQRFLELSLRSALLELSFFTIYVFILILVANGNRDFYMYHMTSNVENVFTGPFSKVTNREKFWTFMRSTVVSELQSSEWYNGKAIDSDKLGFLSDYNSYIVGPARLRQLRVKRRGTCEIPGAMTRVSPTCDGEYSWWNNDDGHYTLGWKEWTASSNDSVNVANVSSELRPWVYQPTSLTTATPQYGLHGMYYGGGYILELQSNNSNANLQIVENLERGQWIDSATRAIFVELIVYNPNANLFSVVSLLAEFSSLGKVYTHHEIATVRLYLYQTTWSYAVLAFQIMFVLVTFVFAYREVNRILLMGTDYFRLFWNLVELCVCLLSLAQIGLQLYTTYIILDFTNKAGRTNERSYSKYKRAASWDQLNTYVQAWLVCAATLKLMHLCRFNKHVERSAITLTRSTKPLLNYMVIFIITVSAFCMLTYLVLGASLEGYSPYITNVETMLGVMLGGFDFNALSDAHHFLGPAIFFGYLMFVNFLLLMMFCAILDVAYHEVIEGESEDEKSKNQKITELGMAIAGDAYQRTKDTVERSLGWQTHTKTVRGKTPAYTKAELMEDLLQARRKALSFIRSKDSHATETEGSYKDPAFDSHNGTSNSTKKTSNSFYVENDSIPGCIQ
ncbi:polycystin family receptor for egg jelly-like isoform X2 [Branchiostoma floridae x Branchiostoma belcheri]